jgi:hypothetical protein
MRGELPATVRRHHVPLARFWAGAGGACACAQVILWVLGEYGSLADIGASGVLRALSTLAEEHTLSDPVRGYLLAAMAKLAVQVSLCVQ